MALGGTFVVVYRRKHISTEDTRGMGIMTPDNDARSRILNWKIGAIVPGSRVEPQLGQGRLELAGDRTTAQM